jgi:two-component sensor histidine kinase
LAAKPRSASPLAALQTAIDRVRAGDRTARSSTSPTVPGFVLLGRSSEAMAEALERHEAELQRTNADRRAALAERELLLREMNHRVKNSLQLVASVLALQARGATDPELGRHIAEAQARVLTVPRIHERLYQADTIATVEFAEYLRELCGEVAGTLWPAAEGPRLVVEAERADLPVHQAVPLALIANELVTNALNPHFPSDRFA